MSSALQRLAQLVQAAEDQSRSQRNLVELEELVPQVFDLHAVFVQHQTFLKSSATELQGRIAKFSEESQKYQNLTKEVARYRRDMNEQARKDLDKTLAEAEEDLKRQKQEIASLQAEVQEREKASGEFIEAAWKYYQLRTASLSVAERFPEVNRIVEQATETIPVLLLRRTNAEVTTIGLQEDQFGILPSKEKFYLLKIWLGSFRKCQDYFADREVFAKTNTSDRDILATLFRHIRQISKQYEPGYIDEFRKESQPDWDPYIAEARVKYRQVVAQRNLG